jgi:signal transduction histidine kinase/ABC-type nitrate/sulfonate/bicarbonate transport system substrate-binding protein
MKLLMVLILLSFHLIADNSTQKVSLQLKWKHQFQFAGFYIAKAKGFYKDEGLDVTIKEFESDINVAHHVMEGKSHFGIDDSQLIYHRLHNMPIVAMMAIFQNSPLTILTTSEHKIKTLQDFHHKSIEFTDNQSYETAINTLLKARNIEVKKVLPSFSVDALIKKEVDGVLSYLSNEPYLLEKRGYQAVTFSPKDYGIQTYGDMLFTSQSFLHQHPKVVESFYHASKKGWEYAFEHIDESVELILKEYNTQNKTKDALIYEAKVLRELSGIDHAVFGTIEKSRLEVIANSFSILFPDRYDLSLLDDFIYHPKIHFTPQEKAYLANKKELRVCYAPLYSPIIMLKENKPAGVAIEYLNEIQKVTGFDYHYIRSSSWREHIALAKEGKCDLVPIILKSPNTYKEFLKASQTIMEDYFVLMTRIDLPYTYDLNRLKSLKIGVIQASHNMVAYLKEHFPQHNFKLIASDSGKHILSGEVDAIITTFMRASTKVAQHPTKLKIMTRISQKKQKGSMGVNAKDPMLLTIINKSINALSPERRRELCAKYRPNEVKIQKVVNYTLLYQVILIAFAILGVMFLAYRKVKKLNEGLELRIQEAVEEIRKKEKILQQQSKLAQMGEMISMIAHQWRQPLSAINNIILNLKIKLMTLAPQGKHSKEDENFYNLLDKEFDSINELIQSLSTTIDDFRLFYKANRAKERVRLSSPIDKALQIIHTSLKNRGIRVQKELRIDREVEVYASEIMQVILNILKNSEDNFTERAILNPTISITTAQCDDKYLSITLCDNGGGIEESVMEHIFDPYFSTKEEKNGTGLGLYMSKMIVQEHHAGKLEVYNHQEGVCFKIVIPL